MADPRLSCQIYNYYYNLRNIIFYNIIQLQKLYYSPYYIVYY